MSSAIAVSDVHWAMTRALVASVTTVAAMVLIARGLSPADAGHYQMAEMLVLTGATAVNAGHADTGLRFAASETPERGARIGHHLLRRATLFGLLVVIVACAARFGPWTAVMPAWLPWLGLAAAAAGLSLVEFGLLQGFGAYRSLARVHLIVLPTRVLAGLGVLWAGGGMTGLLTVLVGAHVVGLFALSWVLRPHLRNPVKALEPDTIVRLHRYGWQMAVLIGLTVIVWDRSELFFLAHYCGPVAVAFYATTFTLASFAMRLVPGVVGGLLTPRVAGLGANEPVKLAELYRDGTRYLFAVIWPIALFGSCFAASLLVILYGPAYAPAALALPPLLLGAGAGAVAAAEASVKFGLERPDLLLRVAYFAAAINLALDWWLIPRYGWLGAAWANASAQLLAVSIGAAITCRLLKTRFPGRSLLKAALAGGLLLPVWWALAHQLPGLLGMALGVAALVGLYPPLLLATGFLTETDRRRWRELWRRSAGKNAQPKAPHGRHHAHRD